MAEMLDPDWTPQRGYSHAANLLVILGLVAGPSLSLVSMAANPSKGSGLEPFTFADIITPQEQMEVDKSMAEHTIRRRWYTRYLWMWLNRLDAWREEQDGNR